MMREIQVLDQETIDKIAAGEVVERPASVVKELMENAIDAMATAVTVEIKDGGISLIRITDNGSGIPASQIRTAFLRHATSKIRKVEDLTEIASLGFRGEALSSISAVSKVELITKTPDALTGIRFCIEGGVEKSFEEIGAPSGTTFIIRHLFFNTPARAKFLKSASAEGNHISSVVEELALSHPEISIKLIANGQTRLYTSGNGSLKEVVYQIYGRDLTKKLIALDTVSEGFHIHGYIGNPEIARGNRNFENYFVNGRYVKSRLIAKAIEDAYHGFLMRHRYPFTLLFLELSGKEVDINVHPTKMEVRISNQEEVYHKICLALQNALLKKEQIPEVDFHETRQVIPENRMLSKPVLEPKAEPFEKKRMEAEKTETVFSNPPQTIVSESSTAYERRRPEHDSPSSSYPLSGIPADSAKEAIKQGSLEELPDPKKEKPEQLSVFKNELLSKEARKKHRIIGQIFGTYWLIEYEAALYIIDQHAAHEKVLFEQLMADFRQKKVHSQMLLPSRILNLSAAEARILEAHKESFLHLGFEIESFGGNTYKMTAVPSNLYRTATEDLFTDVLDQLEELGNLQPDTILERIASMSCKAAVKGNSILSVQEADALIDALLMLENPYHCPHGRPTIIKMTQDELDRKFKRIVS